MMSGSFVFYFHLLGFGLLTATIAGGWFLNVRFTAAQEPALRNSIAAMMRLLNLLFPVICLLLLATGIGSIFNLYHETPAVWYQQGWLVFKIVLFSMMLVNGTVFGPQMSRKRMRIIQNTAEIPATDDDQKRLKYFNRQMNWFFAVQSIVLLGILFFSAFGPSKHPGYF